VGIKLAAVLRARGSPSAAAEALSARGLRGRQRVQAASQGYER
jgi:hypothetical protein